MLWTWGLWKANPLSQWQCQDEAPAGGTLIREASSTFKCCVLCIFKVYCMGKYGNQNIHEGGLLRFSCCTSWICPLSHHTPTHSPHAHISTRTLTHACSVSSKVELLLKSKWSNILIFRFHVNRDGILKKNSSENNRQKNHLKNH